MRTFTFRFLLSLFVSFAFLNAQAQTKTLDNVLKIQLRNLGTIFNKNQVTGYYMFYKVDRIDRKTNSYLLRIFDQNLNQVSENKIEESKYFTLLEGAYNDESLMFKFYDASEKKLIFYNYDNKSQLKSKTERKLESKYEVYAYSTAAEQKESDGTSLFAVPNRGFIDYGMKKEGKLGYAITFYPENKDQQGWKYESPDKAKEVESTSFFAVNKDILLSAVIKKRSINSTKMDQYLLAIDIKSGKLLFEKQVEDPLYTVSFMNGFFDENTGNIALLGQYYKLDDNVVKDKSLGLCSFLLSRDGTIITKNYASWLNDVRKFLPVNAKGKIEDVGYLYFHKIIKTADGKVFAIGEQYRKVASALGIAFTVLGGGRNAGVTKMVIEDMVVMEFSSQFKLENVKIFDKSKTNIELGAEFNYAGPQRTAAILKGYGYFDYSFTQPTLDNTAFTVGYIDYEKNKGEKGKVVFSGITYSDKNYAIDKLPLKKEGNFLSMMPAKSGYVTIFEYFQKEKKLDMRLEKINY